MHVLIMAALLTIILTVSFVAIRRVLISRVNINSLTVNSELNGALNNTAVQTQRSFKHWILRVLNFFLITLKYLFIITVLFFCCQGFLNFAIYNNQAEVQRRVDHEMNLRSNHGKSFNKGTENESKGFGQDKNQSAVKIITADQIKTKFTDVAGLKEPKDEVLDIINFLKDPTAFTRLGAKTPKGILLYGEPGTGKTLLARAIAGEAGVSFIAVSGSEFDEEYVGVGAARVRQMFEAAREHAPCIIFIDEIDALAHKRLKNDPSWSAQTINQLLSEMDGLDEAKNQGIVVIGASNRMEAMDEAVLRPGRLDRHIKLDIPTLSERVEVLELYLKKVKAKSDVHADKIAKITPGFSSAELANLVNEAAIIATKAKRNAIEMHDFDNAKDRVVLGSKRAAVKVTAKERKITAYHEAGHTLVGHLLGAEDRPIYKVTITPRGRTLGHTSFEPSDEEHSMNLKQAEDMIATLLAGRIAEELIFGEQNITTGAESDLQRATSIAYNMVTRWGYSKRVGLVYHDQGAEFVSKDVIEQEVQQIIQRNYDRAKQTLQNNRAKLEGIAKGLLDQETLDSKQIKEIIRRN